MVNALAVAGIVFWVCIMLLGVVRLQKAWKDLKGTTGDNRLLEFSQQYVSELKEAKDKVKSQVKAALKQKQVAPVPVPVRPASVKKPKKRSMAVKNAAKTKTTKK